MLQHVYLIGYNVHNFNSFADNGNFMLVEKVYARLQLLVVFFFTSLYLRDRLINLFL